MASRNDTSPSGPGKSLTCCAPPKSTSSEVVLTVMSDVLDSTMEAEPSKARQAINDSKIALRRTKFVGMICSSFKGFRYWQGLSFKEKSIQLQLKGGADSNPR